MAVASCLCSRVSFAAFSPSKAPANNPPLKKKTSAASTTRRAMRLRVERDEPRRPGLGFREIKTASEFMKRDQISHGNAMPRACVR
jgi:hypothetical protein